MVAQNPYKEWVKPDWLNGLISYLFSQYDAPAVYHDDPVTGLNKYTPDGHAEPVDGLPENMECREMASISEIGIFYVCKERW